MNIEINLQAFTLAPGAALVDALAVYGAKPPFAAAVNGAFVARSQHALHILQAGDRVDVVQPVAGG
jgi:sulfur carrier protein